MKKNEDNQLEATAYFEIFEQAGIFFQFFFIRVVIATFPTLSPQVLTLEKKWNLENQAEEWKILHTKIVPN